MPEDRDAARDAARAVDHAGIEHLIDGLVPALVAKLGTLNVGELEVRQDDWRIRLRRPAGSGPGYGRRAADRAGQKIHPGHDGVGAPAAVRGSGSHPASPPMDAGSTNGSGGPALAPVGPGRSGDGSGHADDAADRPAPARGPIATSPAVGFFQPGPTAVGGTRVRTGDRLGVVDMLGIPHDVISPADGIVIGVIVESGTAVEYGQELVHIEAASTAEAH